MLVQRVRNGGKQQECFALKCDLVQFYQTNQFVWYLLVWSGIIYRCVLRATTQKGHNTSEKTCPVFQTSCDPFKCPSQDSSNDACVILSPGINYTLTPSWHCWAAETLCFGPTWASAKGLPSVLHILCGNLTCNSDNNSCASTFLATPRLKIGKMCNKINR